MGGLDKARILPVFMDMEDQAATCPAERKAIARENFMIVTDLMDRFHNMGQEDCSRLASASLLTAWIPRDFPKRRSDVFFFDSH